MFDYNIHTKVDDETKTLIRLYEDISQPLYYNGVAVADDDKNGNRVVVFNGSANEEWSIYYIGDINADLQYNAEDYGALVNLALQDEYREDADIYTDGVLDVLDICMYERYVNIV